MKAWHVWFMLRTSSKWFEKHWTSNDGFVHLIEEIAFLIDETFGKVSPLDSVLKMENVMRCCRSSVESQLFVLSCMADLCLNRIMVPQEMTPNFLFGKGTAKGTLRW